MIEAYTNTYTYDEANRLTAVDSIPYTWDTNGNMLDDKQAEVAFSDNGLGSRGQQSEGAKAIPATL